jgi:P2-related tail formation protein
MSRTLRESPLLDLCAPSLSYDKQVQAGCRALDPELVAIIDDTEQASILPNIPALTNSLLIDILAWQFHVDFYDETEPLEFRKQLVQQSIPWHKTKGTVTLLQTILDTYWPGGASIEEWFQYKDPFPPNYPEAGWNDRYRFRILIDERIVSPSDEAKVLMLINLYKPVSRWCEAIVHARVSDCSIGWAGMVLRFVYRSSDAPTYP